MTHARTLLAGVLILAPAALFGCGGQHGGDASCGVTAPCGGDLVGTWVVEQSCAQLSSGGSCTVASTLQPSLTYVFRADGTFTLGGSGVSTYSSTYGTSCFGDGGATCTQLDDVVQRSIQSPDASLTGGGCQENGQTCLCTFSYRPTALDPISGTYRIEGTTLRFETTTAAGTGTSSADYCVRGSSLHLFTTSSADGGSRNGTVDVVLVRQ
jgi:hypothetical protein